MSVRGRAQDALYMLWGYENGYSEPDTVGPVQEKLGAAGILERDWIDLVEPILDAVTPVLTYGPISAPKDQRSLRGLAAVVDDPSSTREDLLRAAKSVLASCDGFGELVSAVLGPGDIASGRPPGGHHQLTADKSKCTLCWYDGYELTANPCPGIAGRPEWAKAPEVPDA